MQKPKQPHLPFLDWMRGLAATIMLQGHTFHAFMRPDLREQSPYVLSQFVGGFPPAVFLFLTGVTFAFILESNERRGLSPWQRWTAALARARYLFVLAMLFRVQLWAFSFGLSSWTDIFKVDVLNIMGLTLFLLSPLALAPIAERARLAGFAGALITISSPVISQLDWKWLHPFLSDYIVPSYTLFPIFPWAAFTAFGVAAGCLLKAAKPEHLDRLMQWTALVGFVLIYTAQYLSNLPYSLYAKSEFWLNSPGLVFMKLGTLFLLAALAYLWSVRLWGSNWSWVRQLGTTSLLVYWVHIELVYGWWFSRFKDKLDAGQCVLFSIALILAMIGLSLLQTRLKKTRWGEWRALWSRRFSPPSTAIRFKDADRVPTSVD